MFCFLVAIWPTSFFLLSCQTTSTVGAYEDYWKHATQSFQNHQDTSLQSNFQKPLHENTSHPIIQNQQQTLVTQVSSSQYTEVQQTHTQPLQPFTPADTLRVSKLQIPTNPRIASNMALAVPRTIKETATSSVTVKPAYVSVSLPKPNDKVLSSTSDSNAKVRSLCNPFSGLLSWLLSGIEAFITIQAVQLFLLLLVFYDYCICPDQ